MSCWVYKRFCKRCGEYSEVNGKNSKFCESCLKPKFGRVRRS